MHGKIPSLFFSKTEADEIVRTIQEVERLTSGEIRVHLLRGKGDDLIAEGRKIFEKLGMTATQEKNGVLFLLDVKQHRFAILGDSGIYREVGRDFWQEIRDEMEAYFKEKRFVQGLQAGIRRCGEKLKEYFPASERNLNELPDELSS
ncbi:MAG TPA: hypothetical protein DF383_05150 [Deltaproteobacteria bacterium]|nr:hypothetical protein [Deltaproteobacteria bacterium]